MRFTIDDPHLNIDQPELSPEEWTSRQAGRRTAELAEILERLRLNQLMPQERLAGMTGLSVEAIRNLEGGGRTDFGHTVLVAEALGLDVLAALRRAVAPRATRRRRARIEHANDAFPTPLV